MELYFSPLACSLASRIALYEAQADATFTYVDSKTKRTEGGADYLAVNPAGLVPALRTDEGEVLTENAAVLGYLADTLAPARSPLERARVASWIGFVNSELHSLAFTAILDPGAPEEARAYAMDKAKSRFAQLEAHLKERAFLTGAYSVADGYLFAILNWTQVRGPDLAQYPALAAYRERLLQRPAIARAMSEELPLYFEEQKRRAA